ncbi:phosphoribosylaminoimidazolesuccinocarboxamide synthase [Patescibacteria group bacterium]
MDFPYHPKCVPLKEISQGKIRTIFAAGTRNNEEQDKLFIVASDRISAFDFVLPTRIPEKGGLLTKVTDHWLRKVLTGISHHLITTEWDELPDNLRLYLEQRNLRSQLEGRFSLVRKAEVIPIECIVRGYITGSGWKDYQRTGMVCGLPLPSGLVESEKLPEPLFTPSTKASQGEHDENISYEQTVEILEERYPGRGERLAEALRDKSLQLYQTGAEHALARGIIIADTKFEFGLIDGEVALIDEVLTPDSSRFWPKDTYQAGRSQESLDKQPVRDWLTANWDRTGDPPELPNEVVQQTTEQYREVCRLLTSDEQ